MMCGTAPKFTSCEKWPISVRRYNCCVQIACDEIKKMKNSACRAYRPPKRL